MSDPELIRQYAQLGSEEAFTALVTRYVNLVYSSARRQVRSDDMAREVTQVVFLDLSFNAKKLRPDTHLGSWLYVVTRRTAIDAIRREARRQKREQVAVETAAMKSTSPIWMQIEPYLDECVAALEETDRKAVLLRYFESKSLREIGETLGVSEDAAQKRVSRALERLRESLLKRGVTVTASGIAADVSINAIQAAPAGLGSAVSSAIALSGTAIHQAAIVQAAKTLAMTTTQKTIFVAMIAVAIGGGIFQQNVINHQKKQITEFERQSSNWNEQMRSLRTQLDTALAQTVASIPGRRAAASASDAAGRSNLESAVDPRERLRILEDLQKRKLLNSFMTFIDPKGALSSAFIELFSLTAEEQASLQKTVSDARRDIENLMAANATIQRNSDSNVVINVRPFDGGLAIDDSVMDAIAKTLGPDRFSSFLALGASQVQQVLGNFGAEEETITITNNSASPNLGNGPGYVVVDTQQTPNSTYAKTYQFPSLEDVSAQYGPVIQAFAQEFLN